jgi:hypothetical protein
MTAPIPYSKLRPKLVRSSTLFDEVALGPILNNKAIVLESFVQFFGMVTMYFSKFLTISKKIEN